MYIQHKIQAMYSTIYLLNVSAVAAWADLSLPLWVPLSRTSVSQLPCSPKLNAICLWYPQTVAMCHIECEHWVNPKQI